MVIKCIGTGSSGNCYVLKADNGNMVMLDAGLSIKDIKIGIDFQVSKLQVVCLTHGHQDHLRSEKDLRKMGIPIIAPFEGKQTSNVYGLNYIQSFALTDNDGNPTHSNGDGSPCECYGYIVSHPDMGRLLYVTDTQFVKYRFQHINHMLIGCNFASDLIAESENTQKKMHCYSGHMSLETCKDFVASMTEKNTISNIMLCHLSADNSNDDYFTDEIKKVAKNANVCVLHKGTEIRLM